MSDIEIQSQKPKRGRPSIYTPALAKAICDLYRSGVPWHKIQELPGMPGTTTMDRWRDDPENHPHFGAMVARAQRDKAAWHAERGRSELYDLDLDRVEAKKASAHVTLAGSRAKYDQWLASVLDKETYGTAPTLEAAAAAALVLMSGLAKPPVLQGTAEASGSSTSPPALPSGDEDA